MKMEKFHLAVWVASKVQVFNVLKLLSSSPSSSSPCEDSAPQPLTANFCIWLDGSTQAIPFFMRADSKQVTFGTCHSSSLSSLISRTLPHPFFRSPTAAHFSSGSRNFPANRPLYAGKRMRRNVLVFLSLK